ncbi:Fc.00g051030.m01.CDS01 [Cosmosporella sp. VM-42]
MSLTKHHLLAREQGADIPDTQEAVQQHAQIEASLPDSSAEFESQLHSPDDDMMAPQHTERAPALPEKSSLRASRLMDVNIHKLVAENQPPFTQTAPHDVYLSSEEDASSSADDFSDFDFESGSEDSKPSVKRRESREDTARMVSVVFAGKPSIVDLPRRSMSPSSNGSNSRPPSRLRRTSTDPILGRRLSICSSASSSILHPPRTSSMGPRKLEKNRPQFLNIDPFAAKTEHDTEEQARPQTPKSPGMFKRTLSLVRKKSKPALNAHYAMQSRDSLALPIPSHHMEQVQEVQEEPAPRQAQPIKPITYNEIMKSAKRRTQTQPMSPMSPMSEPATPLTPNGTRNRLRHFSARRRSIIRV